MSCSTHKLTCLTCHMSHISHFMWKKYSRKWFGVGLAPPVPSPFVYGPIERIEGLSKMVHNLLECSKLGAEDEVDEIMANYSDTSQLKVEYVNDINKTVKNREITKQEWINESKLRIKLGKLSGYECIMEIYSCQRYFLKIYEGTTPKRMMQDILKNKLVEESALLLVKSMTDIEDL